MPELGRHEDERGVIEDLLITPLDSVTRITSVAGAIRGNHFHKATWQWTYIVSGRLLVVVEDGEFRSRREYGPGELICDAPGAVHAWKALEPTEVLVFTQGPRSGENYETDTVRLEKPILT